MGNKDGDSDGATIKKLAEVSFLPALDQICLPDISCRLSPRMTRPRVSIGYLVTFAVLVLQMPNC